MVKYKRNKNKLFVPVQVAHFEPDIITLHGEGVFPRVSLDLPRYMDDEGYYESLLKEARKNLMPEGSDSLLPPAGGAGLQDPRIGVAATAAAPAALNSSRNLDTLHQVREDRHKGDVEVDWAMSRESVNVRVFNGNRVKSIVFLMFCAFSNGCFQYDKISESKVCVYVFVVRCVFICVGLEVICQECRRRRR